MPHHDEPDAEGRVDALPLPPLERFNDEIVRLWMCGEDEGPRNLQAMIRASCFGEDLGDCATWGIALADLARHITAALEDAHEHDPGILLVLLTETFMSEIARPSDGGSRVTQRVDLPDPEGKPLGPEGIKEAAALPAAAQRRILNADQLIELLAAEGDAGSALAEDIRAQAMPPAMLDAIAFYAHKAWHASSHAALARASAWLDGIDPDDAGACFRREFGLNPKDTNR